MATVAALHGKPANALVQVAENGELSLRGFRCDKCGAVVSESTLCCRACGCRTAPAAIQLGGTGTLYTWSVVHRSFPGVAVPFVSAIVDLDGGLTLKGTLRNAAHDGLHVGLPVEIVFDDAGGAKDPDGGAYIGFHFEPLAGVAS